MTDETPAERPRPRARPAPLPAPPATPPATPRATTGGGGSQRTTGRGAAIGIGLVLVVALVFVDVYLLDVRGNREDHNAAAHSLNVRLTATERARTEALASARTRVEAMLSYSYTALATYRKQAPTNAVGRFRTNFTELVDQVFVPAAARQHLSTRTTVKNAGVKTAGPDQVVVLLLIDQTITTNGKSSSAQVTGSQIDVTMAETNGTWLVADLKTV